MKNFNFESHYIKLIITGTLAIGTLCAVFFPITSANYLNTMLSASTVGIFILTGFYADYTRRQIKEIQLQRSLQLQPYPTFKIKNIALFPPRVVRDVPNNGKIELMIDVFIEFKIKNVGNGISIFNDYIFEFANNKENDNQTTYARRIHYIKSGETIHEAFSIHISKSNNIIRKMLSRNDAPPCAAKSGYLGAIKHSCVYKNTLNAIFKTSSTTLFTININDLSTATQWISAFDSFYSDHSRLINEHNTTWTRDREESQAIFKKIEDGFYKSITIRPIYLEFATPTELTTFKNITEKEDAIFRKRIHHGMPIPRSNNDTSQTSLLQRAFTSNFEPYGNIVLETDKDKAPIMMGNETKH